MIGPFRKLSSGNKYIVVATDCATRWAEAKAIKDKTSNSVAQFLLNYIFIQHGPPNEIRYDRGTEFINSVISKLTENWNSGLKPSSIYHPQANSLVERCNKTLTEKLRKLVDGNEMNWDKTLPYALFSYRISSIRKKKKK